MDYDDVVLNWGGETEKKRRKQKGVIKKLLEEYHVGEPGSSRETVFEEYGGARFWNGIAALTMNRPPIKFKGVKNPKPVKGSRPSVTLRENGYAEIKLRYGAVCFPLKPTHKSIPEEKETHWLRWKDKNWLV